MIGLSSCLKEFDNFYPYRVDSLSYLDQLQEEHMFQIFDNKSGLEFFADDVIKITISPYTFEQSVDSVIFKWKILSNSGEYVSNRVSFIDENNVLISGIKVIEYDVFDKAGKQLNQLKSIKFGIPFNSIDDMSAFRYNGNTWFKSSLESDIIDFGSWEIINGENVQIREGYIVNTMKQGLLMIGYEIPHENSVSRLNIQLPDNFDVENSIVQILDSKHFNNLELNWDKDQKRFVIPDNIILPVNGLNIIVLSEDENKKPFFGMKYAVVNNNENISIELNQTRVEDIKAILGEL